MKKLLMLVLLLSMSGTLTLIAQSDNKVPPPPPPPPKKEVVKREVKKVEMVKYTPPVITVKGKKADEFYQRNTTVKEVYRQGDFITVKLKDGKSEKYDFSIKNEQQKFTDKYGESPIPQPPTPPKPVKS